MNKMKDLFRWLFLLPIAILCGVAILFILHLSLITTLSNFVNPYPELPERILTPFFFSFAFIVSGSKIAPKFKSYTALVLCSLFLLIAGTLIYFIVYDVKWFGKTIELEYGGLSFYLSIVGAFVGVYYIFNNIKEIEAGSNELLKENLPNIIGILLFVFCIFNPTFRVIIFSLFSLLGIYQKYHSIKESVYDTISKKIKFIYEMIFIIAMLIGIILKDAGLIVSLICFALSIFGIIWSLFVAHKKNNIIQ